MLLPKLSDCLWAEDVRGNVRSITLTEVKKKELLSAPKVPWGCGSHSFYYYWTNVKKSPDSDKNIYIYISILSFWHQWEPRSLATSCNLLKRAVWFSGHMRLAGDSAPSSKTMPLFFVEVSPVLIMLLISSSLWNVQWARKTGHFFLPPLKIQLQRLISTSLV